MKSRGYSLDVFVELYKKEALSVRRSLAGSILGRKQPRDVPTLMCAGMAVLLVLLVECVPDFSRQRALHSAPCSRVWLGGTPTEPSTSSISSDYQQHSA